LYIRPVGTALHPTPSLNSFAYFDRGYPVREKKKLGPATELLLPLPASHDWIGIETQKRGRLILTGT
jgi:hypothetical protein